MGPTTRGFLPPPSHPMGTNVQLRTAASTTVREDPDVPGQRHRLRQRDRRLHDLRRPTSTTSTRRRTSATTARSARAARPRSLQQPFDPSPPTRQPASITPSAAPTPASPARHMPAPALLHSTACTFNDNGSFTGEGPHHRQGRRLHRVHDQFIVNNVAPDNLAVSLLTDTIDEGHWPGCGAHSRIPARSTATQSPSTGATARPDTVLTLSRRSPLFSASHPYLDDDPTGTPTTLHDHRHRRRRRLRLGLDDDRITVNNVAPVLSASRRPAPSTRTASRR